jgi:Protein of unknown function (DUF4230)
MRRLLSLSLSLLVLGLCLGLFIAWRLLSLRQPAPPDPPAVVEKLRQVARLETLEVRLYKKVTFAPEPEPADSVWGDLAGWLRHTLARPRGKAIVFAVAHIGLDVSRIGPEQVEVRGREVAVVLPPLVTLVELRPGETEVIGSNLDSAQTAKLLELAKVAFEREVQADRGLQGKARAAAEQALTALLLQVGVTRVEFVDRLPRWGA